MVDIHGLVLDQRRLRRKHFRPATRLHRGLDELLKQHRAVIHVPVCAMSGRYTAYATSTTRETTFVHKQEKGGAEKLTKPMFLVALAP